MLIQADQTSHELRHALHAAFIITISGNYLFLSAGIMIYHFTNNLSSMKMPCRRRVDDGKAELWLTVCVLGSLSCFTRLLPPAERNTQVLQLLLGALV